MPSDDAEPLIGQQLNIRPLIGPERHIQTRNDSIKNLYNLVEGTVGTLSCGDIMEIKQWWMSHCVDGDQVSVSRGEQTLTPAESWSLHSWAQSLSRLPRHRAEWAVTTWLSQPRIVTFAERNLTAHCTALLDNREKISWYALKYDNFQK